LSSETATHGDLCAAAPLPSDQRLARKLLSPSRFPEIRQLQHASLPRSTPPELGYLTISNALQWRLQYSRVIEQAG
jgi:hypothetical protein